MDQSTTATPTEPPFPVSSPWLPTTPETDATPGCPPAGGSGTIDPDTAIVDLTFLVNGRKYVLAAGDTLDTAAGDAVKLIEATICTSPFTKEGGEICLDIAPLDKAGKEVTSQHIGTHMLPVRSGFHRLTIPDKAWSIAGDWQGFIVVLNHWPLVDTGDSECGGGRCEQDDRFIVNFFVSP